MKDKSKQKKFLTYIDDYLIVTTIEEQLWKIVKKYHRRCWQERNFRKRKGENRDNEDTKIEKMQLKKING